MLRLYRRACMGRATLSLMPLLGLDGVDRLRHRLKPSPRYRLAGVVADTVASLFYLLQSPLHVPEAPLYRLLDSSVHLASKQRLAPISRVVLGEVFLFLGPVPLVLLESLDHPYQLASKLQQPLSLLLHELLVQLVIRQNYS